MLICFRFPPGYEINPLQSKPKKRAIAYKDFTDPKWSAARNLLSEILRRQIPYQVSECTYGLESDELRKARK